MRNRLPNFFWRYTPKAAMLCLFLIATSLATIAQCTLQHFQKVSFSSSQWIGNGFIKGHLAKLPQGYDPQDQSTKYPVILYFHGLGAMGDGTTDHLCRIVTDVNTSLPSRIENNEFPETVTSGSQTFSYIVLCPQYNGYGPPYFYDDAVDDFITYALANYNIDPHRVYITGMSGGANVVVDYIASSVAHAQRVAAASLSSLCYPVSIRPNGPSHIVTAGLPVWFAQCSADDPPCGVEIPDTWVSEINGLNATPAPRFTRLDVHPSPPWPFTDSLYYCRGWKHDTWTAMYSPLFVNTGPDLYHWLLQYQRATLPVELKNFTARLVNGKVQLRWVTTSETNHKSFTIERAGANQQFSVLATLPATGNSGADKEYTYMDEHPLSQLSYYRLLQTDLDGAEKRFEIKKIMNNNQHKKLVTITTNPFRATFTAFIDVDKVQLVTVLISDAQGRTLVRQQQQYAEGSTEMSVPTIHLAKGIYYFTITGDHFSETHKIIKQ